MSWLPQTSGTGQITHVFDGFLDWWLSELKRAVPTALQGQKGEAPCKYVEVSQAHLDDPDRMRSMLPTEGICTVRLSEELVHRTVKTFPLMSKGDLIQAIDLQIEQIVPLKRNEIVHTSRIVSKDRQARSAEVEIVVVRRQDLARLQEAIESLDVELEKVTFLSPQTDLEHVFISNETQVIHSRRVNAVLLVSVVILGLAAVQAFEVRSNQSATLWDTHLRSVQSEAAEARALDAEVTILKAQLIEMATAKSSRDVREILGVLAKEIPDDHWVSNLLIEGSEVQIVMHGQGVNDVADRLTHAPQFTSMTSDAASAVDPKGQRTITLTLAGGADVGS